MAWWAWLLLFWLAADGAFVLVWTAQVERARSVRARARLARLLGPAGRAR
jgi:hypothetical protein